MWGRRDKIAMVNDRPNCSFQISNKYYSLRIPRSSPHITTHQEISGSIQIILTLDFYIYFHSINLRATGWLLDREEADAMKKVDLNSSRSAVLIAPLIMLR